MMGLPSSDEDFRHKLRHGRGYRYPDGVPVWYELGAVFGLRRQHHRPAFVRELEPSSAAQGAVLAMRAPNPLPVKIAKSQR